MIKHKKYQNGLTLIVSEGGAISCSFAIMVGTGSVNETSSQNGLSHFIEHVNFKGTKNYSVLEIPEIMESAGVNFNAYTASEVTAFHAQTIKDSLEKSFEIMSELVYASTYPEEEVEKEKGVIIEEISMSEDTPDDVCYELAMKAYFGLNGYGRTILGPKKNIQRFTKSDIEKYKNDFYVAENTVVSFVGNVTLNEADYLVQKYLMPIITVGKTKKTPKHNLECLNGHLAKKKNIEQVQLVLKFPSRSYADDDNMISGAMGSIIGGGMSSRLFRKVREELGLAYSVGSYNSAFKNTGTFNVFAGVNAQNYQSAYDAIISEIESVSKNGVTEEEVLKVKNQLKASTVYSQERPQTLALLYARYYLLRGELYDFDKRIKDIEKITTSSVKAECERLSESVMATAIVGKNVKPLK
ncbi:MAG: insulinase family protein [Clostridia bacterium]|nr:insulinase family protein [Clostridia bacterium]